MVGSLSSRIPARRRFENTAATRGRSAASAVSFSTMEARITASSGVRATVTGDLWLHSRRRFSVAARCIRSITDWRVSPRETS